MGDYETALLHAAAALEERAKSVHVGPLMIAYFYADAGDVEHAIDWMEEAQRIAGPSVPYLGVLVKSEAIQKHPRFIQLLRDLNLDYWVEKYSQQ